MKRTWFYFVNTFEVNTRRQYGKMLKIANDHDSRLAADQADPEVDAMWKSFNPSVLVYRTLFSTWKVSDSIKKGKTMSFTKLVKELGEFWIRSWEGKVHNFFPEGSVENATLFPFRREPFLAKNYEERVLAVQTLAETMKVYPELKDVQTDVAAKYNLLLAARDNQKQGMQKVDTNKDGLEAQRLVIARLLFENLGVIMKKYSALPTDGERFFDLSLLRRPSSDTDAVFDYSGTVNGNGSVVIPMPAKLEMSVNAILTLANASKTTELFVFFANSASATDSPQKAVVAPNDSVEVKAAELGWSTGNGILVVKNAGVETGEYELTVAEAVA